MRKAIDRIFTFGAEKLTPKWCQTETHWSSKLVDFLWVDCPCCLLFRGIVVGMLFGMLIMGLLVAALPV